MVIIISPIHADGISNIAEAEEESGLPLASILAGRVLSIDLAFYKVTRKLGDTYTTSDMWK